MHRLPLEGRTAGRRRAVDIAREIPTCGPDEPLADVAERMGEIERPLGVVVGEHDVVLGRLDGDVFGDAGDANAGEVMELAPSTSKPDTFLHDLVEGLRGEPTQTIIVTAREPAEAGRLRGVLFLEDVERTLEENEKR